MMLTYDMMKIRLRNWREKMLRAFVWKLPKEIIAWAVVRATAHATSGRWSHTSPSDLDPLDILNRWNGSNETDEEIAERERDAADVRKWKHQRLFENIEIAVIVLSGGLVLGLLLWMVGILK